MNLLDPPTDEELAFHESGHVMVALELDIGLEWVTINHQTPDPSKTGPKCCTSPVNWNLLDLQELHDAIEKDCICLAGGYWGACLFFDFIEDNIQRGHFASRGISTDFQIVTREWPISYEELIQNRLLPEGYNRWNPDWYKYSEEARRIIIKHEALVRTVAHELVNRRTLWPNDIDALAVHRS